MWVAELNAAPREGMQILISSLHRVGIQPRTAAFTVTRLCPYATMTASIIIATDIFFSSFTFIINALHMIEVIFKQSNTYITQLTKGF